MINFYTGRGEEEFFTDLAAERHRADLDVAGISLEKEKRGHFLWERIKVSSEEGERSIGRPMGNYDTLTLPRLELMDEEEVFDAVDEVSRELCHLCEENGILPERILVLGLGNRELTPDAIGPRCADMVEATMQLKGADKESFYSLDCSEIAVLSPGVEARSGIEAGVVARGICDEISPDLVIAVDALASGSPERLGSTVQISDTGIFPGSGLGMGRSPINEDSLGVPVIAIGVPTVINAKSFLPKTHSSVRLEDTFLSPKDIDTVVKNASRIIAGGINQAFGIFS